MTDIYRVAVVSFAGERIYEKDVRPPCSPNDLWTFAKKKHIRGRITVSQTGVATITLERRKSR